MNLLHRNIREGTKTQYRRTAQRIAEKIGVKELTIKTIKDNYALIYNLLQSVSLHQRKFYITVLLVIVSPIPKQPIDPLLHRELVNLLHLNHNNYMSERKTNKKNPKEEKNWMNWDEVLAIRENLEKKYLSTNSYDDLTNLILISLYTIQRPRRLEYADCIIINENEYKSLSLDDKKKSIFLVVANTHMYFSFGADATKTEIYKNYQIVAVKQNLYPLLRTYINNNNSRYLLSKNNGNKISHAALRSRLNNIFGKKKISASMLRKIYISSLPADISFAERENIANEMGHTAITAMKIYNKI